MQKKKQINQHNQKLIHQHQKTYQLKEHKEKILQRTLVRSVETGANGTQQYVLKEGPSAGKIAKRDQ